MGVREDRLRAEHSAMQKFRSNVVTWRVVGSDNPASTYHITYDLKSIVGFSGNGTPKYHKGFDVEVRFPGDYPRGKPEVRLLKKPWPVHPNIWSDGRFCLEGTQHWIPGIGVPLDALCYMIGEIIAFQEVNRKSPANGDGKLDEWILNNLEFNSATKVANPVDPSPIRSADVEDAIRWGAKSTDNKPRIRFGKS